MKFFALGGYGKVGIPAIKLLAESDLVAEITLAGRDLERAEMAALELGEKATAVQADGTNEQNLAPLVKQEIICRLLLGEQGDRLRHLAVMGGYTTPIARAIQRFRENFNQKLRIDDVAEEVGMSVSSFHHQFKAVTSVSPLQFQKQLRLQEARRLMLGEDLDATSTALRVGYNDSSHFSREYKRLFGYPPMRDVERLRAATG